MFISKLPHFNFTSQDLIKYDSFVAVAQNLHPYVLTLESITYFDSSLLILFSLYLIYKLRKVPNREFFILSLGLILIGLSAGVAYTALGVKIAKEISTFPSPLTLE